MKGGLFVIHAAVAALADLGALESLPLGIFSAGDEEISSLDSCAHLQERARGAAATLVFEAGRAEDAIITRRKGTGRLTVYVQGRAAHAGNEHHQGINAIWALARYLDACQSLTDYERGLTVSVGLIEGGSSANTIPAEARCVQDFRYLRAADGDELLGEMRAIAKHLEAESGARFHLEGGIRRAPLERSPESLALMERYAEAAATAGLGHKEAPLIGGGSDASTTSALGIPTLDGLGPRGRGFHSHQEFIEISSLHLRAEALLRFLLAW